MSPRLRILCTNDDGVHAAGLRLLAEVARDIGQVEIVAPDRQQSAASHSLTLHRPLRATHTGDGEYVVDGTPTDCVLLAVNQLLETPPDFVFSGVNHGPNMGEDVLYSGTVAAAMEGTIFGIRSVAVSFASSHDEHLPGYARVLRDLLGKLVGRDDFPPETCFNINLPDRPAADVQGVRVTSLGRRVYADSLIRREDPSGKDYFWIGGGVLSWSGNDESDFQAIENGYVSVTPLHLDLTNHGLLRQIRSWDL